MTISEIMADILSASGDAAYDWDLRSDRMIWFGNTQSFFGSQIIPPANAKGFASLVYAEDRERILQGSPPSFDRQYRLEIPGSRLIWVHERGIVESQNGQAVRQKGVFRLAYRVQDRPARNTTHGYDNLTGCLDRAHMLEQLGKAMDRARAAHRSCAYFVVGIDKMSFVNEAVGMEAGDVLLCSTAKRLAEIIPARSILGRVGGDMFGVLLPDLVGSDPTLLAEKLLQSFRDKPVVTSVTPLHITVSIGGISLPDVARNPSEAMVFAEQALHDARQRGRNVFVEYLDSPERAHENRQFLELAESIKHAFKHNGFRLAYQPIVDADTGQPVYYEALIRMFDNAGKPISAADFVPAIEQLGLAMELDKLVLDLSIKELEAYPELRLSINVSGMTAAQASWPEHVQAMLGLRDQVAQRLVFEITETAAIVDVSETKRFVDQVRKLGGKVALDDFGAGFTSIRHLRSLAISIMKIDKDLLQNLAGNAEQQHLVRVLIELARGLGMTTVAEGVESEDIAAWLKREKVDMMQGYYFGKPMLDRPWAPAPQLANVTPITAIKKTS